MADEIGGLLTRIFNKPGKKECPDSQLELALHSVNPRQYDAFYVGHEKALGVDYIFVKWEDNYGLVMSDLSVFGSYKLLYFEKNNNVYQLTKRMTTMQGNRASPYFSDDPNTNINSNEAILQVLNAVFQSPMAAFVRH